MSGIRTSPLCISLAQAPVFAVGLAGHLKRHPLPDPGKISPELLKASRTVWDELAREMGLKGRPSALLTAPDANAKLRKGQGVRPIWSLTLAPAISSGLINTCVRYADCASACVLKSGKGALPMVQLARNVRTALLYRAPEAFAVILAHEIDRAGQEMAGHAWALRPNAASDIPWETAAPWLLERVARNGGTSYDYTKAWSRRSSAHYALTLSVDSRQDVDTIADAVRAGQNVAVIVPVRKGAPMPSSWHGLPAVDGDTTDARCDDPSGVVVLLRAKGALRGLTAHPMVRRAVV